LYKDITISMPLEVFDETDQKYTGYFN
jgi:hypothetical protein